MRRFAGAGMLLFLLYTIVVSLFSQSLQQGMNLHRDISAPAVMSALSPARIAKLEADKRFSEFNHRFAGLFVLLAGLVMLLESELAKRIPIVRYLWFLFFLIPGMYLFILSDDESWPVGSQTLRYVITSNHQVLEHKIFALLLLGLGIVEFLRVRNELKSIWAVALFPALAAAGAVLLLFHAHPGPPGAAMDATAHLAMQKIDNQHLGFAVVGFGIALSKAALDLRRFNARVTRNIFALLMALLGILLLGYTE